MNVTVQLNDRSIQYRLGYFQLENVALTRDALVDRVTKHYVQQVCLYDAKNCLYFRFLCLLLQALLQVYKIIFGLELLGNPVGFVTGLKDGAISLFYYPIQVRCIFKNSLMMCQNYPYIYGT